VKLDKQHNGRNAHRRRGVRTDRVLRSDAGRNGSRRSLALDRATSRSR
jgi:hypothetical protein